MHRQHAGSSSGTSNEDVAAAEMPPSKRRKKGHSMEAMLAREVGLMRDASGEASASFVGSASGIHFIRAVYGAIGSVAQEETSPVANLVPGEDDRLDPPTQSGSKRNIWHEQEVCSKKDTPLATLIPFDDLLDWTESFFDNWHPPYPVLHAPSVLAILQKLSENGLSSLPFWDAVIVRAIISISLADRRQSSKPHTRPIPSDLVFTSFDHAHEAILPALTRPATIHSLQATICVQMFLVSMLRLNTASRLGGLIVQMAFQLGLHRCPMRYQAFRSAEQQLRKRIFWSLYCIERYICQAMGLPLTIRDEDADVCHLNEEIHRPKSQDYPPTFDTGDGTERESSVSSDGRLQLLVFLSQHAQLRGSIIELRNKRVEERDRDPDAAILINAKLTQWWNEVEDFFDQNDEASSPISPLHKVVLKTLKHESTIMLHRPMLASLKATASYTSAVHACIGAAKSLLNGLYALTEEPRSVVGTTARPPMMWPSFTWAVWMSAFILLYATSEGILNGQVTSRNVDKSLKILNRLAARGSVWPEASAVAIQDLRSILSGRQGSPLTPSSTMDRDSTEQSRHPHAFPSPSHARGRPDARASAPRSNDLAQSQFAQPPSHTRVATGDGQSNAAEAVTMPLHIDDQASQVDWNHRTAAANPHVHNNLSDSQGLYSADPAIDLMWPGTNFLPKDVPPMAFESGDPFQGFDIPFWFGQDNYVAWMGNET